MLKRFWSDVSANIAVPAVVGLLGAATLVGGLADFMSVSSQRSELQQLADLAALNAVRELAIAKDNPERIEFVASAYVASTSGDPNIKANPTADPDARRLSLTLTAPVKASFPGPFSSMKTISVTSEAELLGEPGNICLIGLDGTRPETIEMSANARITADGCSLYSNSTSSSSMSVTVSAQVKAEIACVAGGFSGNKNLVNADVITDCPTVNDPLSGRPVPFDNTNKKIVSLISGHFMDEGDREAEGCDYFGVSLSSGETRTLNPGVYCGGITITGGTANLNSGVYVMKDGSLTVWQGGSITGTNVGFFMTGPLSTITFTGSSTVSLTAPKTGSMAGMLFFEDPSAPVSTYHTISSDNARRLVGTIYLPASKLLIQGNDPIADQSEYTIIVARVFELKEGPNLVLKTDYALSDIPVPDGVGPLKEMDARLVR
ncbi:MAG: pilus assembly protein TadG-related protein [Pseudomonadota bacterium]